MRSTVCCSVRFPAMARSIRLSSCGEPKVFHQRGLVAAEVVCDFTPLSPLSFQCVTAGGAGG